MSWRGSAQGAYRGGGPGGECWLGDTARPGWAGMVAAGVASRSESGAEGLAGFEKVEAGECAGFKERWRKGGGGRAAAALGRGDGDGRVAQQAA
eukprot:1888483-Prymnesium_polylepis.1